MFFGCGPLKNRKSWFCSFGLPLLGYKNPLQCLVLIYEIPPPEYEFSGVDDLTPDSVVYAGGIAIISPSGIVLARPNYDREALI